METIELTCIICPNGCALTAEVDDGEVMDVTGNKCMRGFAYAQTEIQNPTRMVTSTVEVNQGTLPRVPVKTSKEIPKDKIMECAGALKGIAVDAPVEIGDVVIEDVVHTGADIIATGNVTKKTSLL